MYISLATTLVPNWPPVMVRTMSKIFRVPIEMVTMTTTSAGRMLGMVTRQNICHGVTPSMRAASTMSAGMALIAADSTTMAKPAWIHTITAIRNSVFQGPSSSHCCGVPPNATTSWFSRPICSAPSCRYSYTNFQMMPAPTNEMAIGMKISDLAKDSKRARSTSTA